VLVVDLDGERVSEIRTLDIPTTIDFTRIPARGAAPLDQIVPALAALPDEAETEDPALRPYLEVCVALDRPDVTLRQRIDDAVVGKRARLLKLTVEYTGHGMALADVAPPIELRDLDPTDVFARRYRRDHDGDPPPDLLEAFCELLEHAHAEVGG